MADRASMPTDVSGDRAEEDVVSADGGAAADGAAPVDGAAAGAPVEGTPVAGPRADQDPGLPTSVPRSVRSLLWQARLGAGLAVLFAALALLFYVQASDLRADAAARADVLEAGRAVALQITTYDGAAIDQWVADTQEIATPEFAEEVAGLFDPELREGLAANEVVSSGALTSSFVQEVDGDEATVFAVLRQTYSSINLPREVSDQLRMEVELQRVDGRWLAANVVALGPSTISPVTGGEAGAGAAEDAPVPAEEGTEGS